MKKISAGTSKKRVVMTLSNDLSRDGRVQKEAQALFDGGYEVYIVGIGTEINDSLKKTDYKLILTEYSVEGLAVAPRLGREDVFWPIRVIVNKTIGAHRQKKLDKIMEDGFPPRCSIPTMQKIVEDLDPDYVHCHDLDTLLPGFRAAQTTGAELIYDSHELFLAQHTLPADARQIYSKIETLVFPQIDGLVTVSPDIGEILCEKYKHKLDYVVTYNGGLQISECINRPTSPIKLFFQGSFAHDRNNIELIRAMVDLRGLATLTLQGWGVDIEAYQQTIKELHLEDTVFIIEPCGPLEVVEFASNYDVGVINSKCVDENFRHTLPNKLFDYMCAGLAVVSTDLPPIKKILDNEGCGITFEQRGVKHTAEVLKELVMNPDKIMAMKEASIKAAQVYAWPAQAKKLQEFYQRLETKKMSRK